MSVINLDLWIPSLFDTKGGIQVYSRYLLDALGCLYPEACRTVTLKNDFAKTLPRSTNGLEYFATGQMPLPRRTLSFAYRLISRNLRQPADLIISTHLNFTVAGWLLKQLKGIPYWTVAHGIEAWGIKSWPLKLALRQADCILAVSHYTRDRLIREQNLNPNKVVVLPNTFDASRFKPGPKPEYLLKKHRISHDQPVLLTVSRLAEQERYKGYDQVLKALPDIQKAIPNIHYVLVGKGPDRSRIEYLIEQLGLKSCVTLAGFIPDKQLGDYYNLCDVFAMPSKREGFGIVYLEAMASGKPVLGGNRDGAVDALCHGELGVLVDPDNISEIAEVLIQLFEGNHHNSLLYRPTALRQKAIDTYGLAAFHHSLARLMDTHYHQKVITR